jgi:hypothetical protein
MGNVALRAAGLTKRYGRVVALDGLDLEVGTGEVMPSSGRTARARPRPSILLGLPAGRRRVSLLGRDP